MADEVSAPVTSNPTRTELELAGLEHRRAELLAKKAVEDAVKAQAGPAHRRTAVALHAQLCITDHGSLACTWFTDSLADDPEAADWAEPQHQRWLAIAMAGITVLRAQGWTVLEPQA